MDNKLGRRQQSRTSTRLASQLGTHSQESRHDPLGFLLNPDLHVSNKPQTPSYLRNSALDSSSQGGLWSPSARLPSINVETLPGSVGPSTSVDLGTELGLKSLSNLSRNMSSRRRGPPTTTADTAGSYSTSTDSRITPAYSHSASNSHTSSAALSSSHAAVPRVTSRTRPPSVPSPIVTASPAAPVPTALYSSSLFSHGASLLSALSDSTVDYATNTTTDPSCYSFAPHASPDARVCDIFAHRSKDVSSPHIGVADSVATPGLAQALFGRVSRSMGELPHEARMVTGDAGVHGLLPLPSELRAVADSDAVRLSDSEDAFFRLCGATPLVETTSELEHSHHAPHSRDDTPHTAAASGPASESGARNVPAPGDHRLAGIRDRARTMRTQRGGAAARGSDGQEERAQGGSVGRDVLSTPEAGRGEVVAGRGGDMRAAAMKSTATAPVKRVVLPASEDNEEDEDDDEDELDAGSDAEKEVEDESDEADADGEGDAVDTDSHACTSVLSARVWRLLLPAGATSAEDDSAAVPVPVRARHAAVCDAVRVWEALRRKYPALERLLPLHTLQRAHEHVVAALSGAVVLRARESGAQLGAAGAPASEDLLEAARAAGPLLDTLWDMCLCPALHLEPEDDGVTVPCKLCRARVVKADTDTGATGTVANGDNRTSATTAEAAVHYHPHGHACCLVCAAREGVCPLCRGCMRIDRMADPPAALTALLLGLHCRAVVQGVVHEMGKGAWGVELDGFESDDEAPSESIADGITFAITTRSERAEFSQFDSNSQFLPSFKDLVVVLGEEDARVVQYMKMHFMLMIEQYLRSQT